VVIEPLGTPPLLVTVNAWVGEVVPLTMVPKPCGLGEMVRLAGSAPVPLSAAEAVPPGEATACRAADFAPLAVGANAPSTVQLWPAPSFWPLQLSAYFANWPGS
jgi:hypothetical protein